MIKERVFKSSDLSLRSRRQSYSWGGAEGGTPGIRRNRTSSRRSGRQLFVIRDLIIIEIMPMAAARFAGLCDKT
jgi:hypothetical protein